MNFVKQISKCISLLLIIGLNWSAISAIGWTRAYFNDAEASEYNLFSAAKLDFSLDFLMSDGFRTQTQGGWGSEAQGDNPGAYRDANFYLAFPGGLTVGDNTTEYYARFSTSEAVENFLPAKGTPNSFSESRENPIETEAGILAGQIVALALNVGFDNYDPDFSASEGKLSDFYANAQGGLCENMTVGEVLAEANLILSRQSDEFTPSEINECATEINEKFDNGEMVKITPSESVWREIAIIKSDGLNFQHGIRVEQTSGSAELCQSLIVDAYLNGTLLYSGNLTDFVYAPSVFSDSANKWKLDISLPEGAPSSLANKVCGLKYIIFGWQENIAIPLGGFSDIEEVSDSIESGEWVSDIEALELEEVAVMDEFLSNFEDASADSDADLSESAVEGSEDIIGADISGIIDDSAITQNIEDIIGGDILDTASASADAEADGGAAISVAETNSADNSMIGGGAADDDDGGGASDLAGSGESDIDADNEILDTSAADSNSDSGTGSSGAEKTDDKSIQAVTPKNDLGASEQPSASAEI